MAKYRGGKVWLRGEGHWSPISGIPKNHVLKAVHCAPLVGELFSLRTQISMATQLLGCTAPSPFWWPEHGIWISEVGIPFNYSQRSIINSITRGMCIVHTASRQVTLLRLCTHYSDILTLHTKRCSFNYAPTNFLGGGVYGGVCGPNKPSRTGSTFFVGGGGNLPKPRWFP